MSNTILEKELFISGITTDGRVIGKHGVKHIYNQTKKLLKNNYLIPLKLGHKDTSEVLRGKLLDIKLKRTKGNYIILAKMELYDDLAKFYKQGKLPSLSVEIDANGTYAPDGSNIDWYVASIALQGLTAAAQPQLKENALYCNAFTNKLIYFSMKERDTIKMEASMPQLKEIKDALIGVLELVDKAIEDEDEDEEKPKEDDEAIQKEGDEKTAFSKDNDNDVKSLLKQVLKRLGSKDKPEKNISAPIEFAKMHKAFSELNNNGHVVYDEKPDFFHMAGQKGLDEAILEFEKQSALHPPEEESKAKSNLNVVSKSPTLDTQINMYNGIGLSNKLISKKVDVSEKYVASILKGA